MKLAFATAAAIGLALFSAAPVPATSVTDSSISRADATWYFTQGGVAYGVQVQAVIERDQAPRNPNQRLTGVNVQVLEEYIDPISGEPVEALLVSDPYFTPATSLSIDLHGGASVRATVTLTGSIVVDAAVDWTPSTATTRTYSNVWDTEFGVKTRNRTSSSSRDATATGSITGELPFGDLGATQGMIGTAKLFQLTQPGISSAAVTAMLSLTGQLNRSTTWVAGAFADWAAGDARNTQVLFTVEQDLTAAHSAPVAYAEVIQGYCDASTNELVDIDVFSDPTPVTSGTVDSSILSASGTASLTLTGYTTRTPDCAQPRWDEQTFDSFGPVHMTVGGTWKSISGPTFYRSLFVQRGPDGKTSGQEQNRGRQATAEGVASGDLYNGSLTDVVNAFLYDDRTRTSG